MHHFTTRPDTIRPGDVVHHPGDRREILVTDVVTRDDGTVVVLGANGRVIYGPDVRYTGVARPTVSA